jgi:hypothetical protein
LLAEPERGKAILDRIVRLSASYETRIEQRGDRAFISLDKQ